MASSPVADDFSKPMTDAALSGVEANLRATVTDCADELSALALHLIDAGGRRFRPRLVLAAALASGGSTPPEQAVVDAAVVVELVHLASLYHDDVLDGAATRRGRPSVNAAWGNGTAVLGGDLLLAHAYAVAARLGTSELRCLADTLLDLCSGQIAETRQQFDLARGLQEYEASVRGKTSALLAASCSLGCTTAGGSDTQREALETFGTELGLAFQVIDDVLDLTGDSQQLGKPAGTDLREGILTPPILLALEQDPTIGDLLVEEIDDQVVSEVRARVNALGADRRAVELGCAHLEVALSALSRTALEPHGKRILVSIAHLVLAPVLELEWLEAQEDRSFETRLSRVAC